MRLFVALEAPERWRDEAQEIQRTLARLLPATTAARLRPVGRSLFHVTLRFLGDVAARDLSLLQRALDGGVGPVDLTLALGRAATFGTPARTAVVQAGVKGNRAELAALAARVDALVVEVLGVPAEVRPYRPHLTLARVHRAATVQERRAIAEAVRELPEPPGHPFVFTSCVLVHSHLGPGQTRYEVLSRHA